MNFKMSFWNYVETGVLNPKDAMKDWKDLGCNFIMSFEFDVNKHKKQDLIDMLDECHANGMQVIIFDKRTSWHTLARLGVEGFTQGVKDAIKDFGSHPAAFGFHIGDEPSKNDMENMVLAYKIVKENANWLSPFVNFFPIWEDGGFEETLGCAPNAYKNLLDKIAKAAKLEMMCYDYYGQCAYLEPEVFEKLYFKNLKVFGDVARANNLPLYTSLLSVGHWSFRCPTEDDLRWQISTSVALGVTGIFWFFVYERTYDSSYRVPPIDLFWERTETFEWLSRQNRTFMQFIAPKLENFEWKGVKSINMDLYEIEEFKVGDFGVEQVEIIINKKAPLLLAEFDNDGKKLIMAVNAERRKPVKIRLKMKNEEKSIAECWIAPGQGMLF